MADERWEVRTKSDSGFPPLTDELERPAEHYYEHVAYVDGLKTQRLRVDGGWLYVTYATGRKRRRDVTSTFVPDCTPNVTQ